MKFYVNHSTASEKVGGQLLIVTCFEEHLSGESKTCSFASVNTLTGSALANHARAEAFEAKVGETVVHYGNGALASESVLLLGLGAASKFNVNVLKKALVKLFQQVKTLKASEISIVATEILASGIEPYTLGQLLGTYSALIGHNQKSYKTGKSQPKALIDVETLRVNADAASSEALKKGLADGRSIASGVILSRDLATEPAGKLTPMALKAAALGVAKWSDGLITGKYYWGKRLEQMKANCLLAVSAGSAQPPVLIELDYTPPTGPTKEVLCLVGKSVTFDSGGLDLKPADGMRHMKRDMSGGATVLGAIKAIAKLRLPISVKVIMAATENMPDGKAYKPGDVIESMNGMTVEIDNTDAEGRLTLIDAIEFAKKRGVTWIVDFATLTGAVKQIGGDVGAAAFGNKSEFTRAVVAAGESVNELMVEMPMWEELREFNKSEIADVKNSGGGLAGSTTAAWFIREVAGEEIPWVHIDIAGVAYRDRPLGPDPKGASGYGVRTAVALAQTLASSR